MAFPPRFLDDLRTKVSLTTLIGRKVKLQHKGQEYIGLCPFHREKTPSFTVSEEKALKWLNNGAIPTDTVRSILSKQGIMKKFALQKESGK